MRVLWFSPIPVYETRNDGNINPGGNWITSLKELISNETEINLAIAYWGIENNKINSENGTIYYQMSENKNNLIKGAVYRISHQIESKKQTDLMIKVIFDFNPDIIHIFGTEFIFGNILTTIKIPTVIHLQGIINPYLNAWNIPGLHNVVIYSQTKLIHFLKGLGIIHDYIRFKKMAKRELNIFSNCDFFMGRTHWDKAITMLYAPRAKYYHCDEVIRRKFYDSTWQFPEINKFIISTTINPNIYKGLDLVLKTATLLKSNSNIDFQWNVYGISPNDEYARIVQKSLRNKFDEQNISLKGKIFEEKLIEALLNSHLFIHCSYIDNSPNSVCEAQLLGMPVIATNVGGISTLINNGKDGFLVPSNEPHFLAYKIIELYSNKEYLKKVGIQAQIAARKRHDKLKIKNDLLNIYRSILEMS